jgi:hypothetical protein
MFVGGVVVDNQMNLEERSVRGESMDPSPYLLSRSFNRFFLTCSFGLLAPGKPAAVVEEAKRRIEAGEPVTVEAMHQYAAQEHAGVFQDLRGTVAEPFGRPGAISTPVATSEGSPARLSPFEHNAQRLRQGSRWPLKYVAILQCR